MSPARLLSGLSEIAGQYDVLFCDVWGVVHNGRNAFAEACDALIRYGKDVGPVVLVSNAPRPAAAVKPQIKRFGVPDAAWSDYVTSGDATMMKLAERAPGPAWAIGPDWDRTLYEGTGVAFAEGPADAGFISCTGFADDETETPDDYRAALKIAADRGLEMVCANPDRRVHRGEKLIYCAGALADVYEEMGGRVIMAGKPYGAIYEVAYAAAERLLGKPADRSRILCIGDGPVTDVLGANNQKLDCLFIAGGLHGDEVTDDEGALDADRLGDVLARDGVHAEYVMWKLAW